MQKPPVNEFLLCVESVADGTRPTQNNTWGLSVTPANGAYGSFAAIGVLSSTYDIYEWSVGVHNVGIATWMREHELAGGKLLVTLYEVGERHDRSFEDD